MNGAKIVAGLKDAVAGNLDRVTIDGQVWSKRQPQQPRTLLDGNLGRYRLADILDQMVFTAAKDWHRTITIDRNVRDLLVSALRKAAL